jgi:hypothetical protein
MLEMVFSMWSVLRLYNEVISRVRVLKPRCDISVAYTERPTPPLVEKEASLLNKYMFRREQKSWSWISMRPEAKNDCAGEGQQQFNRQSELVIANEWPVEDEL